jgi:hypothetical protein
MIERMNRGMFHPAKNCGTFRPAKNCGMFHSSRLIMSRARIKSASQGGLK